MLSLVALGKGQVQPAPQQQAQGSMTKDDVAMWSTANHLNCTKKPKVHAISYRENKSKGLQLDAKRSTNRKGQKSAETPLLTSIHCTSR